MGPAGIGVFNDIKKFAAETPFEVDTVTESFIKLQSNGFSPTIEKMGVLGDLAASKMRGIDQLAEAVIDAGSGQFERLLEFNIRASRAGDKLTLTHNGIAKTMKFSQENVENYLLSLGKMPGIMGASNSLASTFIGQQSNINDKMTQYKDNLGKDLEPVLSKYLEMKSKAIDKLQLFTDKLIAIPAWLKENQDGLKAIGIALALNSGLYLAYVGSLKAVALWEGIVSAKQKAGVLISQVAIAWDLARAEGMGVVTAAQWALNAATSANPIGLLIVATAALGAGLYYAYQKLEVFRAGISGLIEVGKVLGDVFIGVGKSIAGALTFNPKLIAEGAAQASKAMGNIQKSGGLGKIFDGGYDQSIAQTRKDEQAKAKEEKEKQAVAPMTGSAKVPGSKSKQESAGKAKDTKIANESVAGGKSVKNISIHIAALVKEQVLNITNLKGTDSYELKRMVTETLLGAVRDAEIMVD